MLAARTTLVDTRRDLENQMRGLFKSLGIVLGKADSRVLAAKIAAVLQHAAHLRPVIEPLMEAHASVAAQVAKYDAQVKALTHSDQTVRRLMTVPGRDR